MGNFNRGLRPGSPRFGGGPGGGRGFDRRGFGDRGSRGPVEMHQTVCDNCKKSCEVPFKPTSGKPVYCSSCFENNRGSDAPRYENRSFNKPSRFEDKQMFDAVCEECKNRCKVPFQPSGEKPVYCSSCFGDKKEGGSRNREQFQSQPQYKEQFEQLNYKLDKILSMLISTEEEIIEEETINPQPEEQIVSTDEETEEVKKKPSKKK